MKGVRKMGKKNDKKNAPNYVPNFDVDPIFAFAEKALTMAMEQANRAEQHQTERLKLLLDAESGVEMQKLFLEAQVE